MFFVFPSSNSQIFFANMSLTVTKGAEVWQSANHQVSMELVCLHLLCHVLLGLHGKSPIQMDVFPWKSFAKLVMFSNNNNKNIMGSKDFSPVNLVAMRFQAVL